MKTLDQSVFARPDCPNWAESAAIHADGRLYFYECDAQALQAIPCSANKKLGVWRCPDGYYFEHFESSYDTTNWQNSAIDRVRS